MEIFNRSKVLKYICLKAFNCSSIDRYCDAQNFFSFYKQTTYEPLSKCWSFYLCRTCNTAFADHMVALFLSTLFPTKHSSSLFRGKGRGIYLEEWDGKSLIFVVFESKYEWRKRLMWQLFQQSGGGIDESFDCSLLENLHE